MVVRHRSDLYVTCDVEVGHGFFGMVGHVTGI